MAYAAVISLKQTIKPLLNPSHVSIDQSSSRRIIQPLYEDVCSLQEVLKQLDSSSRSSISRKRVNALDGDKRDAVSEFEDVVESHFSNWFQKILGEEEIDHHPLMDLLELKQDINSFTRNVNKMKAAYIHELFYPSCGGDDDDDDAVEIIRSRIDLIGRNDESKMVGLSDLFTKIKKDITVGSFCSRVVLSSLVGMAGIGKTTLAKKLYHDPLILSHFERRAFVSLGCKYQLKSVLLDILKQVNHHDEFDDPEENMMVITKGEEEEVDSLTRMISESLMGRRYLIVLDDVWDVKFNDQFTSLLFPCIDNYGSRVLMTTRLRKAARTINWYGGTTYDIRFLDKNKSWDLLRAKVFGEESSSCPTELEKAGKKIAENCEGLPLTIVTVADILSKSYENSVAAAVDKQKQNSVDDKTKLEYWNEVAADKQHSVFVDAYDQMWEVLYPSYDYLDQHLKPCFLYMGVFPQNHEIPCSKLFNLWIAEGFSESNGKKIPAYFARSFLFQLSSSNVVLDHKTSLNNKTKICGLISPFWHLCVKEAAKNKFFHGLNKRADGLAEDRMKGQRRLSIRNNVLFGIKDVFDSMGSISTVRSILCTGSYHEYPVPICVGGSRLLMILDALTVNLYEFPIEVVVNLVQLTLLLHSMGRSLLPYPNSGIFIT